MFSAKRIFSSEEALYTASLRALARRAYSVFELRVYLEARAEQPSVAARVLARLKQEKLLDDGRYALEFARMRANSRRQGRYRIARELRQRGVPNHHIEAALRQVFAETDERMLIRKVIERRLRSESRRPGDSAAGNRNRLDNKKMASLYRTLLRAGFDAENIRRETRAAMAGYEPPQLTVEEEAKQGEDES